MEHDLDIRATRDHLGMTQAQLAEAVGVDQSTVSNWERGVGRVRGPARKMIERLLAEQPTKQNEALA